MSKTPQTDCTFRTVHNANHPETDSEHFRAEMESARKGVEALEQERDGLLSKLNDARTALQIIADRSASWRMKKLACETLTLTKP